MALPACPKMERFWTSFQGSLGNSIFEEDTHSAVRFIFANRDAGLADLDNDILDPSHHGVSLTSYRTPFELIMGTRKTPPDFDATYDPFAGLLSSMNARGL